MEQKKKILIVEDEQNIAAVLAYNIVREGYGCDVAKDGEAGLCMALTGEYDLILLDFSLPKMTGLEVCDKIRRKSGVPIIFVTGMDGERDKILALETGADDYVTKPFSFRELLSRIRANIRRAEGGTAPSAIAADDGRIAVGDLIFDTSACSVSKGGEELALS
ncbi:MAG: response regulator transcription factor, partial [Clostridia bacterium]|nr:response regulator transcription factor [Clostridia bacterium]